MDFFELQIQTIKEMLNWRVSLDILIIAVLIFSLYQALKATGTGKIAVGILVAGGIFMVASILKLKGIEWIYSNLSQILLIALIVIFQPELRKIFERAATITRRKNSNEQPELSYIITEAVFSLADQNHGAIFVFPGKDSIKPWTSEGIKLNAQPNYPILMSIFDPHSPGHDGAVVIENGHISSFAVRLPLSDTGKLSDEFGTRHHAGLGLSEVTDALIVVVSEERGTITVFDKGDILKIGIKGELSSKIILHWENKTSFNFFNVQEHSQNKQLIKQIAISFGLAFLFWSSLILTQVELREMDYNVPIEYISKPENLLFTGEKPAFVKMTLLGKSSDMNSLNPLQLKVVLDLSSAKNGLNILPLNQKNVMLSPNIRLTDIEPSKLSINLIELKKIAAAVTPQLIGALPDNYEISSIVTTPDTIVVFAPINNGDTTDFKIYTMPIYLCHINQNTTIISNLIIPKNIQPFDKQWPEIKMELYVEKLTHDTTKIQIPNKNR